MTNTVDGFPVTRNTIEVVDSRPAIATNQADLFTARAVIPVVAMLKVGNILHAPGDDDNLERLTEVQVVRIVIPAGEDAERVLDLLRNGPDRAERPTQREVAASAEPEPTTAPFIEMRAALPPDALADRILAGNRPDLREPLEEHTDRELADAVDDDAADAERSSGAGGFTMPPPPRVPDGEVTLRRIAPLDKRLRRFVGDSTSGGIVRGGD